MTAALTASTGADVVEDILAAIDVPVLVYFLVMNTSLLVLVVLAAAEFSGYVRRIDFGRRDETVSSRLSPGISVIVPMHNEEAGIVTSVTSLLALRYPRHEIVVVDDGSTDGGFAALRQAFDLVEVPREMPSDVAVQVVATSVHLPRDGRTRLTVVCKENSGKTDSVNNGINAATEELIAIVDADSILEPDCLLTVTQPFADDPTRMVATGGVVRAANGCTTRAGRII